MKFKAPAFLMALALTAPLALAAYADSPALPDRKSTRLNSSHWE